MHKLWKEGNNNFLNITGATDLQESLMNKLLLAMFNLSRDGQFLYLEETVSSKNGYVTYEMKLSPSSVNFAEMNCRVTKASVSLT